MIPPDATHISQETKSHHPAYWKITDDGLTWMYQLLNDNRWIVYGLVNSSCDDVQRKEL